MSKYDISYTVFLAFSRDFLSFLVHFDKTGATMGKNDKKNGKIRYFFLKFHKNVPKGNMKLKQCKEMYMNFTKLQAQIKVTAERLRSNPNFTSHSEAALNAYAKWLHMVVHLSDNMSNPDSQKLLSELYSNYKRLANNNLEVCCEQ